MKYYTLDNDHNVVESSDYVSTPMDKCIVQKTVLDLQGNLVHTKDVKYTECHAVAADQLEISTVFLGIDHSFGGGKPVLFETMCFSGSYTDLYCRRYRTWDRAYQGHFELLERIVSILKTKKLTDFRALEIE